MPPVIFAGGRFVLPFTILPSLVRFAYFGYNVTNTKEVKVEVTGGGAGGSVAKGASSNVADTKFRGQLAEDGKSPVMTWDGKRCQEPLFGFRSATRAEGGFQAQISRCYFASRRRRQTARRAAGYGDSSSVCVARE